MSFEIHYHAEVTLRDLPPIPRNLQKRIILAIEERLTKNPEAYAERLRKSLTGYWKLRVGDYRVLFTISQSQIAILLIGHRKDVYRRAVTRLLGR